ncbi:FAD-dependent oxidoreductase [soil metagenome]
MAGIERREFIKKTIMGGIAAQLACDDLKANRNDNEPIEAALVAKQSNGVRKKVIVGGAGLGGLCCAYELMKSGHDVTVLEASGRHGGHIFTVHDGLSDGLYGDFGQEHIVKPGYKLYFEYAKELGLEVLPYHRRKDVQRRINGKFYSEAMLADPAVLKQFGFNDREVKYLSEHAWGELQTLYTSPYLGKFTDEYQPFNIGYDDWDKISAADFFKKEGASKTALEFLGGQGESALFSLWYAAILNIRGVPVFPTEVFRLKGGNQMLPNAFAKKLGERVWLNSPIVAIKNGNAGVTVTYKSHGEEKKMEADYFVNCIPLPAFKNIPIQPVMPPEKQYIFDNLRYDSYSRFVFQASSKFWLDDGLPNINLFLDHPDLGDVWHSADEVETHRVIVLGTGPGGVSPQRALAAFREVYPGKKDTIELAIGRDWTKEAFSSTCERLPFPIGQLKKFWPGLMKPEGRIYFAGAYADNLNWGTEAATRSANRVAREIDMV